MCVIKVKWTHTRTHARTHTHTHTHRGGEGDREGERCYGKAAEFQAYDIYFRD